MKLICTADTHGHLPEIEECDLVIFAGDVTPVTNHDLFYQRRWLFETWVPYLQALPAKEIVWIFGNHDFIGEEAETSETPENPLFKDPRIHLLNRSSVTVQNQLVYGYPYVGGLTGWAFNRSKEEREEMAGMIPPCDILVCHAPLYGCGDLTAGGDRVGDPYLRANLKRIAPKLVISGHIHEGYGHYRDPAVTQADLYVVSYLDERYRPKHKPVVIDL